MSTPAFIQPSRYAAPVTLICALPWVRWVGPTAGFTVTTVPLTTLGRREDGSPQCRLVLARRASTPRLMRTPPHCT